MEPITREASLSKMIRFDRAMLTTNRVFLFVVFVIWMIFVVWCAIGIFDDQQPSIVDPKDRTVITPEVYPGSKLKVHVISTPVRLGCESRTTRIIFDGNQERRIIDQPTEWSALTPGVIGEPNEFTYSIPIPLNAAPGDALYQAQTEFRCTMFQRLFGPIVGSIVELKFKIKNRSPDQQKSLDDLIDLLNSRSSE